MVYTEGRPLPDDGERPATLQRTGTNVAGGHADARMARDEAGGHNDGGLQAVGLRVAQTRPSVTSWSPTMRAALIRCQRPVR